MGVGNVPVIAPLSVFFLPVTLKTVTRRLVDSLPTSHWRGLPFECQLCLAGTSPERNKSHCLQYGKQIERTSQVGLHCAALCHATFHSQQQFQGSVLDQCFCSDLQYLTGDKCRSVYRSTKPITIMMYHHLSIVIILYRGTLAVPPPYWFRFQILRVYTKSTRLHGTSKHVVSNGCRITL